MEWVFAAIVLVTLVAALGWRQRRVRVPDTPTAFLDAAALADEGPGAIFADAAGVRFPGPRALAWAYGVLNEAGVDADADPAYAAALLRRAEPRLTPAHAQALVRVML